MLSRSKPRGFGVFFLSFSFFFPLLFLFFFSRGEGWSILPRNLTASRKKKKKKQKSHSVVSNWKRYHLFPVCQRRLEGVWSAVSSSIFGSSLYFAHIQRYKKLNSWVRQCGSFEKCMDRHFFKLMFCWKAKGLWSFGLLPVLWSSSFEWVHKLQPKRYRDKLKLYISRREVIDHCINISKTVPDFFSFPQLRQAMYDAHRADKFSYWVI